VDAADVGSDAARCADRLASIALAAMKGFWGASDLHPVPWSVAVACLDAAAAAVERSVEAVVEQAPPYRRAATVAWIRDAATPAALAQRFAADLDDAKAAEETQQFVAAVSAPAPGATDARTHTAAAVATATVDTGRGSGTSTAAGTHGSAVVESDTPAPRAPGAARSTIPLVPRAVLRRLLVDTIRRVLDAESEGAVAALVALRAVAASRLSAERYALRELLGAEALSSSGVDATAAPSGGPGGMGVTTDASSGAAGGTVGTTRDGGYGRHAPTTEDADDDRGGRGDGHGTGATSELEAEEGFRGALRVRHRRRALWAVVRARDIPALFFPLPESVV
jgi:hypothetical protein